MDPLSAVVGIATQAAGDIASGAFTNAGSMKRQRQAQEYDLEQWQRENQRSDFLWHRQNQYNSPVEQMKRFREAGLNPHMIYSKGNPGMAAQPQMTGIKGAKPAPYNMRISNPFNAIQMIQNVKQQEAQTDLIKEQAKTEESRQNVMMADHALKNASVLESLARRQKIGVDTKMQRWNLQHQSAMEQHQFTAAIQGNLLLEQQIREKQLANNLADQTLNDKVSAAALNVSIMRATLRGKELDNALKEYEKQLRDDGIHPGTPGWYHIWQSNKEDWREIGKKAWEYSPGSYVPSLGDFFGGLFK